VRSVVLAWLRRILFPLLLVTGLTGAEGAFTLQYLAPANPATQGFSSNTGMGPPPQVTVPIADDLGYPAWSISGLALNTQFGHGIYFDSTQQQDIAQGGFTLTFRGRALQGIAPAYDAGNANVIGGGLVQLSQRRFDFFLGINGSGNTVAALVTYLDASGLGNSTRGFGPSYALSDSGYHTYDIVYDPTTQLARLFIDGVERISGYPGHNMYPGTPGFGFDASGGGGMNVNFVRVTSPAVIPGSGSQLGSGLTLAPSLEFCVGQGQSVSQSVSLSNPGSVARSATLEVVNPYSGLTVTVGTPNPVSVAAGATTNVPINIGAGSAAVGSYDQALLKVSADDGSTAVANLKICVTPPGAPPLPDLAISSSGIGSTVNSDGSVTLSANIHNLGSAAASSVQVQFYEFDNPIGSATISSLTPNGTSPAAVTVPSMTAGDHLIRVAVDPSGPANPAGAIQETDESNNEASRLITIGSATPTAGGILVTGGLPTKVYSNSVFAIGGNAFYDLTINGTRYTDYVVKGGSVKVTIKQGETGPKWDYGEIYTDTSLDFHGPSLS
jgi:hypothetical protein